MEKPTSNENINNKYKRTPMFSPAASTMTSVYIEKVRNYDIAGYVHHVASDLCWHFNGIVKLINIFESLFNAIEFPQSTHRLRTFQNKKEPDGKKEWEMMNESAIKSDKIVEKPTFIVKITYRQNSTWQGTIQSLETGENKKFRSALELLKIMTNIVGEEEYEE